MLETKQKSQADAEEEKRQMQQSALAKYRQAFTSDTEVHLGSHIGYIGLHVQFASATSEKQCSYFNVQSDQPLSCALQEDVIHMKLEDDETYEAPEPGEIVDEPEGKPMSGPVLSAPPPSPLPSLEALIKPRQDLVPQQRIFPLPSSGAQQSSQAGERGMKISKPNAATAVFIACEQLPSAW